MSGALGTVIDATRGLAARREQILDAAEACFVRNGFHRTTMQDLVREASMTAGNVYRYFEPKEALVLGLVDRERERGALLVEELERDGDRHAALLGILSRYFLSMSRETAILRLDIWSEATRNRAIAAITRESDAEGRAWLSQTFAALATSPECDPAALFEALGPLMRGLIVDRALVPDYDPAPAVAHLTALLEAGLAGRLPLAEPLTTPPATPVAESSR